MSSRRRRFSKAVRRVGARDCACPMSISRPARSKADVREVHSARELVHERCAAPRGCVRLRHPRSMRSHGRHALLPDARAAAIQVSDVPGSTMTGGRTRSCKQPAPTCTRASTNLANPCGIRFDRLLAMAQSVDTHACVHAFSAQIDRRRPRERHVIQDALATRAASISMSRHGRHSSPDVGGQARPRDRMRATRRLRTGPARHEPVRPRSGHRHL